MTEQWIMWIITAILAFVLVVIIGIIFSVAVSETIPWKYIGIVFAIYAAVVLIFAITCRLLYRGKLIVTESEIIKLHGKKVQFRIYKDNLISIGVRRTNVFIKLLIIISAWIGDLCTDMVSFRFNEAELFEPRKFGKTLTMKSLTDEESEHGIKEFVECLSYRQAKKISEMLNVPLQNVIF